MIMSNGKPKRKDESTNKFLQRIAGKKAFGPPPTPRPVIGEHPVRVLIRENSDERETAEQESPLRTEPRPNTESNSLVPAEHGQSKPQSNTDARGVDDRQLDVDIEKDQAGSLFYTPVNNKSGQKAHAGTSGQGIRPPRVNKETSSIAVKPNGVASLESSVSNPEEHLKNIKKRYRLNSGEFALYKQLYQMTHAVGKTECSFVVSELMRLTSMLERRVRDNLRRLKKNGWIVLLEAYDSENREKAKYRVNTDPET